MNYDQRDRLIVGNEFQSTRLLYLRRSLSLLLGAAALFFLGTALAGPRDYLFQDERICDSDQVFCFQGTLSYRSNPRVLHLRARVKMAPGPGLLRISLSGANDLGHRRFAPLEVRVRGHNSEIINHKMIPDYPDVLRWNVERVEFIAD
jgi:hypothetical protein